MIEQIALLACACLFGGMVFFSFGFAPVLFKQLPVSQVRPLLRGTFPYYYLAIIVVSGVVALLAGFVSIKPAMLVLAILLSTLYARQVLMPKINSATDAGNKKRFNLLHGVSVVIQLIQIVVCGWALLLLT